jgi:hypothetical protein
MAPPVAPTSNFFTRSASRYYFVLEKTRSIESRKVTGKNVRIMANICLKLSCFDMFRAVHPSTPPQTPIAYCSTAEAAEVEKVARLKGAVKVAGTGKP